eukprot:gene10911-3616_t
MKILFIVLFVVLSGAFAKQKQIQALPFDLSKSVTLSPLEASVTLKPNTALKLAGMKNIKAGVKFPDCGNSFDFYLDLSAFGGSIGKVYTKTISLQAPRVCASDLGVSIPSVTACFTVEDLYVFKKTVSGSIVADIGVGVSVLQYSAEKVHLYDFTIGDMTANPCSTKNTQESCVTSKTCGWCEVTSKCFEKRSDSRTDTCKFCPRCSFFTTSTETEMKKECLSKSSCGWCESKKKCLGGDDLGAFDAMEQCEATVAANGDILASDWVYVQQTSNPNGDVSAGTTTFLSFFFLGLGLVFGLIVGPLVTLGIVFGVYKVKGVVEAK